ncbi:hypothetical protein Y1Q_0001621 [Alligator mississippiensis]|uniref:Endonuclease/exonuclease/phosphatase domain-containing protein n=1 Tax=Alligator mississippiensis TaxID=8496 RepID=A0A151MA59_ALLMI|nr:hypothetical protein Y1Q_0001621 [Alligator mississippiensis]
MTHTLEHRANLSSKRAAGALQVNYIPQICKIKMQVIQVLFPKYHCCKHFFHLTGKKSVFDMPLCWVEQEPVPVIQEFPYTREMLHSDLLTRGHLHTRRAVKSYSYIEPSDEEKDNFYQQLKELIGRIPWKKPILVLGDVNAKVGSKAEIWPWILGRHGIGRMNDNGQRVLELCASQSLSVTNTFFASNIT